MDRRSRFEEARSEQLQEHLESLYANEDGDATEAVRGYLDSYTGSDPSEIEDIDRYIANPHCLARFYPFCDQDIVFVLESPRLGNNDINKPETTRLAASGGSPPEMAQISAQHYTSYFAYQNGTSRHAEKLAPYFAALGAEIQGLDLGNYVSAAQRVRNPVNGEVPNDWFEYFQSVPESEYSRFGWDINAPQVDMTKGFYSDIYVTNLFKFGAEGTGKFKGVEWATDLFSHTIDEIRMVNPSLVIPFGASAWNRLREELSISKSSHDIPNEGEGPTRIHGHRYESNEGFDLIPLVHPSYKKKKNSPYKDEKFEDRLDIFQSTCSDIGSV